MPPTQMLPLAGLQVQTGIHDQTEPQAIFHDWADCWLSSAAEWGHWPGFLVKCGQRLQLLFSIIIFCGSHIWLFPPFWLAIFNKILSVRHTFKMREYSYLHIYTQTHIYTCILILSNNSYTCSIQKSDSAFCCFFWPYHLCGIFLMWFYNIWLYMHVP